MSKFLLQELVLVERNEWIVHELSKLLEHESLLVKQNGQMPVSTHAIYRRRNYSIRPTDNQRWKESQKVVCLISWMSLE